MTDEPLPGQLDIDDDHEDLIGDELPDDDQGEEVTE